jgi:hypothetical protein
MSSIHLGNIEPMFLGDGHSCIITEEGISCTSYYIQILSWDFHEEREYINS